MPNFSLLATGAILENRYRILNEVGRGGFGRTYLAEDLNRYNERCILKEFAPQVQDPKELQKAEELFQREAGMLYKLQHPQIPRFRELLRVRFGGKESLFLVQDYVEGQTYWDVLKSRQQGGQRFNEAEVRQLLLQLLPVLDYIHLQGVIHRDVSPDNLIQRSSDRLPVLIDFGGVKQVAATAANQFTRQVPGTVVGKKGYAPEEQLRQGKAFPVSDLYSLAVTVLVLLTGKEPQHLYDSSKMSWRWRQEVNVSPNLGIVLDKMLAYQPRDRYQSAPEVVAALQSGNSQPANLPNKVRTVLSHVRTINFVGGHPVHPPRHTIVNSNHPSQLGFLRTVATGISIGLVTGLGAWGVVKLSSLRFPANFSLPLPSLPSLPSFPSLPSLPSLNQPASNQGELERQAKLIQRLKALKVSESVFYRTVDGRFYKKYPELKGRPLTNKPEDTKFRQKWLQIGEEFLDEVERGKGI